jgi:DNA replication protein DnaC
MSKPTDDKTPDPALALLLRSLRLPSFAESHRDLAEKAERGRWGFSRFLRHLCEIEIADRRERRIVRMLKESTLPPGKSLATLDDKRLPSKVTRSLASLCNGGFVSRAENVLVFGLPGRGKTHLVCAISHELVQQGHRVLFTPTYRLVQRLLAAKRDLLLDRMLARLDRYAVIVLDDIGYVQQSRDEMEVLFTFLAERYERRSVMLTSNLVFSQWDRIFKDPMTTAAAIDRLVHHAHIIEMTGPSIRGQDAKARTRRQNKRPSGAKPQPQP